MKALGIFLIAVAIYDTINTTRRFWKIRNDLHMIWYSKKLQRLLGRIVFMTASNGLLVYFIIRVLSKR